MALHEVKPGRVYAWRGSLLTSGVMSRARVVRPVLVVDTSRVWRPISREAFEPHPSRRFPRRDGWGWLALQTWWVQRAGKAPDAIDQARAEQHAGYLRGLPDIAVKGRPRVGHGQLPAAETGVTPQWCVVHPEALSPWSVYVEMWGSAGIELTDWERFEEDR